LFACIRRACFSAFLKLPPGLCLHGMKPDHPSIALAVLTPFVKFLPQPWACGLGLCSVRQTGQGSAAGTDWHAPCGRLLHRPPTKGARMNIGMELQQRQQLTMTPQLQQALRLLQLSSLEFNREMEAALDDNPFLEAVEGRSVPLPDEPSAPQGGEHSIAPERAQDMAQPPAADASDWGRPAAAADADDGQDWTEWSAAPASLHEQLRNQLLLWPLEERQRLLAHLLIDELSDAGYLETSLEELLQMLPDGSRVTLRELEEALALVQQLEPAGIGARNLQECLLLQLAELPPASPGLALAQRMVKEHFDLLVRRQFPRLAQLLECDEQAL